MREKYTLSDEEFATAVHLLRERGSLLLADAAAVMEIHGDRAREVLRVVCQEPTREDVGPSFRFRYTLATDYAERIRERKLRQRERLSRSSAYVEPDSLPTADLWPSSDPRDFDTDGHGGIRYAGPVKRDPRYDMEDLRVA